MRVALSSGGKYILYIDFKDFEKIIHLTFHLFIYCYACIQVRENCYNKK